MAASAATPSKAATTYCGFWSSWLRSFLYTYLVQYLHFLLTTFVFMALGMFLLNDSGQKVGAKLARVLLAAGITVPVLYAVFNYAFGVVLP